MIKNPVELTKVLSEQAENSGFARAAIIIVMGHDGHLHKTEFGFNKMTGDAAATKPETAEPETEAKEVPQILEIEPLNTDEKNDATPQEMVEEDGDTKD